MEEKTKWLVTWEISYNQSHHIFDSAAEAVKFAETLTKSLDTKIYKWYNDATKVRIESITQSEINHRHDEWEKEHSESEEEQNA